MGSEGLRAVENLQRPPGEQPNSACVPARSGLEAAVWAIPSPVDNFRPQLPRFAWPESVPYFLTVINAIVPASLVCRITETWGRIFCQLETLNKGIKNQSKF